MYNNQRKRKITLGQRKITLQQKQFVINVDHDRINNDPMFLNLRRDSGERIHTQNQSMERMKEISEGRVHYKKCYRD
jgi:hypothetical protein